MSVEYPARFALVCATNPCPCGYAGEAGNLCMCPPKEVVKYNMRLSGPLIDRIDMHVRVSAVALEALRTSTAATESSGTIRERVEQARQIQYGRFRTLPGVHANAHSSGRWLDTHTPIHAEARRLLQGAAQALHLSARAYHRVLKVARTIADLAGSPEVTAEEMAEALRYRPAPTVR